MSLIVNENSTSSIAPIAEGTHLGVCNMLVDLGVQFNETFKNQSRKVLIGWEIPDETIELEDGTHNRTITQRYTASLNEASNLRRDLAAWRGRDFTEAELEEFNLRNIVGASCLLNIIHKTRNGKTYANIQSIMALPKGMKKADPKEKVIIFDLDEATLDDVDDLPRWIGDVVKKSITYQEMVDADNKAYEDGSNNSPFDGLEDDGDLPF